MKKWGNDRLGRTEVELNLDGEENRSSNVRRANCVDCSYLSKYVHCFTEAVEFRL